MDICAASTTHSKKLDQLRGIYGDGCTFALLRQTPPRRILRELRSAGQRESASSLCCHYADQFVSRLTKLHKQPIQDWTHDELALPTFIKKNIGNLFPEHAHAAVLEAASACVAAIERDAHAQRQKADIDNSDQGIATVVKSMFQTGLKDEQVMRELHR